MKVTEYEGLAPVPGRADPMDEAKSQKQYDYFRARKVADRMLEKGLLTGPQHERMCRKLAEKIGPIFADLI